MKARAYTGRSHGGQERWAQKVWRSEIQSRREQERQERNASPQEWDAQARKERPWRQGEESQAGDCDRLVGGTEEGRQGAAEAQLLAEAQLAQAIVVVVTSD